MFVDSEFWHGRHWRKARDGLKTNRSYWIEKIERNMARDQVVNRALRQQGWYVIRFWGKKVKDDLAQCANRVESTVRRRARPTA